MTDFNNVEELQQVVISNMKEDLKVMKSLQSSFNKQGHNFKLVPCYDVTNVQGRYYRLKQNDIEIMDLQHTYFINIQNGKFVSFASFEQLEKLIENLHQPNKWESITSA